MIDSEQVSADLFNTARDSVATRRLEDIEGLEDNKRRRALLGVCLLFSWLYILATNRKDVTVPVGKQQEIKLHAFALIHIQNMPMPELHTILAVKVYVYKRPNSSPWRCSAYLAGKNRQVANWQELLDHLLSDKGLMAGVRLKLRDLYSDLDASKDPTSSSMPF